MKKLSIILLALVTTLFAGCKPDNYLCGLNYYTLQWAGCSYRSYHFGEDSVRCIFHHNDKIIISDTIKPYYIKNKTTFYIGWKAEPYKHEFNPNTKDIIDLLTGDIYHDHRTYYNSQL